MTENTMTSMERERRLQRLHKLARLMDTRWKVLGIPVGVDALMGLVPVAGDFLGLGAGFYMLWQSWRLGVPLSLLLRMLLNYLIDALVGSVPLLGDAFDFVMRAHHRNWVLLERHFYGKDESAGSRIRELGFQLLAIALVCALAYGAWVVLKPWVLHFF